MSLADRVRRGLSDPLPHDRGTPARLPRLGGDGPEAAPGPRRDAPLLRALERQRPPVDSHAGGGSDGALRGGAGPGPGVSRSPASGGDRLHEGDHGGDQPRRPHVGAAGARPGRRDPPVRDGAPLEPGAVDPARAGAEAPPPARARDRRGDARPPGVRASLTRADAARGARPRLERARHDQPGRGDHRARPGGGGAGPSRRRPGGAAPPGGRGGARRRLLRLLGAQAGRTRPASACSTAGARSWSRWSRSSGGARSSGRSGSTARPGTTSRGGSSRARRPSPARSA